MRTERAIPLTLALLLAAAPAAADLLRSEYSEFGALSGGKLQVGPNVQITGRTGAIDDVWLANNTIVRGDLLTASDLSTDSYVAITGQGMAGGSIRLGGHAATGRLDAGFVAGQSGGEGGEGHGGHGGGDSGWLTVGKDSQVGALFAAGRVQLRQNTVAGDIHAGGSKLDVNKNSITGSLFGRQDVTVDKSSVVQGNIHAGADVGLGKGAAVLGDVVYGDKLKKGKNVTINGSETQGPASDPMSPGGWELVGPGYTWSNSHGSEDLDLDSGSSQSISAGAYKDLTVAKQGTVNLVGGEYNFKDIKLKDGVQILADTTGGDVIIRASGDFKAEDDVTVQVVGGGKVWIYAEDIEIHRGGNFKAHLIALEELEIKDGKSDHFTTIEGLVYAGEKLDLGAWSVIDSRGSTHAPEPGTLAVLALGSVALLRRRRSSRSPQSSQRTRRKEATTM